MEYVEEKIDMNKVKDKTVKLGKDIADTRVGKAGIKAVKGFSKGLNTAVNVQTKVLTSPIALVTKPKKGSDPSLYEEYNNRMAKIRAGIKFVEYTVITTLAASVLDPIVKAILYPGVFMSNDPSDIEVQRLIKSQALKFKELGEKFLAKVKSKKMSDDELVKNFKAVDAAGTSLTKKFDEMKKKDEKHQDKNIKESAEFFEMIGDVLLDNGEITLESYDAVLRFIDRADYSNERDVMISEACIDLLLKDCGF